jgi:hypothetical protein
MTQTRGLLLVVLLLLLGAAVAVFWPGGEGPAALGPAPAAAAEEDAPPPALLTGETPAGDPGALSGERAAIRAAMREPAPDVPASDAARFALTGRLVRTDGSPVVGVEVRHAAGLLDPLPGAPAVAGLETKAKTGSDGRFTLRVRADLPGAIDLLDSGLVFAMQQRAKMLVPGVSGPNDLGDLVVVDGAVLAGLVRDVHGRPLAGVRVTARAGSDGLPMLRSGAFGEQWTADTAADGAFRLSGLPAGEYRLATQSAHHMPHDQRIALVAGEQRTDLVVQLESGGEIAGRVVDDLGRPVAGAKVGAYRNRELGEGVQVKSLSRGESTETDANGNFTLGGLAENVVQVRAWSEGYAPASRADVARGSTDVRLQLERYGAIEGVLVDEQGAAIAGSDVSVRQRAEPGGLGDFDFSPMRGSKTAVDGHFRLERVRPGTVSLRASGEGHVDAALDGVRVLPGETTKAMKMVAARGAVVVATVVDVDGRPVAGATVTVEEAGDADLAMGPGMGFRTRSIERRASSDGRDVAVVPGGRGELGKGTTGADGKARIAGLPARTVVAKSSHDVLAPSAPARLELPSSGTVETTLRLRSGGRVAVRVEDADRRPLGDAPFVVRGPLGNEGDAQDHTGRSDATGQASIGPLPTGAYEAVLRQSPRPSDFGGGAMVVFGGGEDLASSKVSFRLEENATAAVTLTRPPMSRLRGTVLDASGPVAGARVELVRQGDGALPLGGPSVRTGSDGRFALEEIAPGDYVVRFGRRDALVPMEESIRFSGQSEVERQLLLQGGEVKITAFSKHDGYALRNAKVTIRRADAAASGGAAPRREMRMVMISVNDEGGGETTEMRSGEQSVKTDEEGVAVLKDIPPGRYRIEIEHSRHAQHTTDEFTVAASATTDLGRAELDAGAAIRATIQGRGERPGHAFLELWAAGSEQPARREAVLNGSVHLTGLAPGEYRLRARPIAPGEHGGEFGPFATVVAESGQTASVVVRLP